MYTSSQQQFQIPLGSSQQRPGTLKAFSQLHNFSQSQMTTVNLPLSQTQKGLQLHASQTQTGLGLTGTPALLQARPYATPGINLSQTCSQLDGSDQQLILPPAPPSASLRMQASAQPHLTTAGASLVRSTPAVAGTGPGAGQHLGNTKMASSSYVDNFTARSPRFGSQKEISAMAKSLAADVEDRRMQALNEDVQVGGVNGYCMLCWECL